jgi:pimeloyl-ACP methyl ester carboxylesterase
LFRSRVDDNLDTISKIIFKNFEKKQSKTTLSSMTPTAAKKKDPSHIVAAGGKYITTNEGRIVEYSVHGKCDDNDVNVPVIVNPYCAEYLIFGKGHEEDGNSDELEPPVNFSNVDYKIISISLPGIGHSDLHPGHRVAKWPQTDLLPILQQENVTGKFHMCGTSLGTLYAVATAQAFGSRIASLGLRVPFLPLPLSEPLGLPNGQPTFPTSQELAKNTWTVRTTRFLLEKIVTIFANPGRWTLWFMKNGLFGSEHIGTSKFYEDYPKEAAYLQKLVAHFPADTMMHLMAKDVALDAPGVDYREISSQDIPMDQRIVWYAADDHDCPPSHGKWLAEVGWQGCHNRVFDGYDHYGGSFLDYEEFMDTLIRIGKAAER